MLFENKNLTHVDRSEGYITAPIAESFQACHLCKFKVQIFEMFKAMIGCNQQNDV